MREWTEQEEQEMIELAKQGDPRANYELSLWALRRSEEEPGEARWNRLAAKCLVKAAQAGYPPAQERMTELLHQSRENSAPKSAPEEPAPREPVRLSDARAAAASRRSQSPAPESTARRPGRREPEPVDDPYDDEYDAPRRSPQRKSARPIYDRQAGGRYDDTNDDAYADDYGDEQSTGGVFANWGERQWRRMEIICVAVCAVLLVVIAVMIITSRGGISLGGGGGASPAIPPAGDASAAASPSPVPSQYPDDDTIAAIQAAELDVYPEESDYVTMPTTATVKVDSQTLRLRTGPSTTYQPPICNMGDGAVVQVYAIKNNWSLVYYEGGEDGPVYGWCSSEYLIVTAGAADTSSIG